MGHGSRFYFLVLSYGIRLTVGYDGTDFCGWQKQHAQRSVQQVLEDTIAHMAGHPVELRVASRTDSGVHALGNVAAFHTTRPIDATGWLRGLNSDLPKDISVVEATLCAPEYNPRFDTLGKRYRYVLELAKTRHPLWQRFAWHPRVSSTRFDVDRMQQAARCLIGTHDFVAFRQSADTRLNTVRTISEVDVISNFANEPTLIAVEISGNAFMQHMMRILVGTLVSVGNHRLSITQFQALLRSGACRSEAGVTAPAHGLCLLNVVLGRQHQGQKIST